MRHPKARRPRVEPLPAYLLTAMAVATAIIGALSMLALAPLLLKRSNDGAVPAAACDSALE